MKREKRLKKSVESIEIQIEKHKLKQQQALSDGKIELATYHGKEIESMYSARRDKLSKLHRKDKNKKQEDIKEEDSSKDNLIKEDK